MINGLYSGATALDNYSRQQELIASNLAHLNTPGHRRQLFGYQEKADQTEEDGQTYPGAMIQSMTTDFSEGVKQRTGRTLDAAIGGDAFFVFQGEAGQLYSRNGSFFRDTDGTLVNGDGLAVLDDGQPIRIPDDVSNYDIVIDSSGTISANGDSLGQLSLVKFDDPQKLNSQSQVYFGIGEARVEPSTEATVLQGSRELSNAHPVTELIGLIVGSRNFESAQRVIRTISDSIQENIRA